MKRAYVLVEGATDAGFLKKVLPPEAQKDVEFVVAGGEYGISSLARSLLVRRRTPVAVFMDSDSLDPDVIDERRDGVEELIAAAAAGVPVKVVVTVPELEACFFSAPELIEKMLGAKVQAEMIALGQRDPKGVLAHLASAQKVRWDTQRAIGMMDLHDIEHIRDAAPVHELTEFLQSLQEAAAAEST